LTIENCLDIVNGKHKPKKESVLLTFDDGFIDHYETVFPILLKNKIQGIFFPPVEAVKENKVLDINKIQILLSEKNNISELENDISFFVKEGQERYELNSLDSYKSIYYKPRRFDDAQVGFIKNMLQKALPEKVRKGFLSNLFKKYVTHDELSLAKEFYMNELQLREMIDSGMFVGSHCYNHVWLDTLKADLQERQITLSLNFLREICAESVNWVMCYPHGAYNKTTIRLLEKYNCSLAFTTHNDIWHPNQYQRLEIPRIDTNSVLTQ